MDEINEQDYKTKILEIYRDYYDKLPRCRLPKRSKTITYLIGKGYEYEYFRNVRLKSLTFFCFMEVQLISYNQKDNIELF